MTTKPESERGPAQVVDRAAVAVRRAIDRLVRLLGDDDLAVVHGAALALDELGARAVVGPLAAALPRARAPRHRAAIIGVLIKYRKEEQAAVLRALTAAFKRNASPSSP
jgi:HEAT repeat protein